MNGMIPTTTTFAPQTQPQMMYDYTVQPTETVHPGQYQLNANPVLVDPATTTTTTSADMMAAAAVMMPFDSMYTATLQPGLTADPAMMPAPVDYNQNTQQRTRQLSNASSASSSVEKIYSFVEIPGTNQKKRPRRRYDEIERLYHCNWPGCTKAYGTLNHLNAHVSMQKHVRMVSSYV
ncbi:hypothetical protein BCV72DRAFT_226711 [Rhizopus microsporus var. microsporus]|uniref:C2H2-type domain-containing protein n=2 Tax=Rhizopus microsporus TaxID=58291 RepID=A0A2G4SYM1_RHIZD|nr:uncharacterized protein RHIMIDRAFT_277388 [Rhizopus microsporus ATCC 52813]ORE07446.1 hypothetical protein BCV72DRAFT_226711 [Rhizopus microsporus var. microsporus]PHZ13834.1 hypothetical protein RHIMIDRAFT_277388 [Rhizopus microsporus ATCC 52813]